jgi:hypothetical protein
MKGIHNSGLSKGSYIDAPMFSVVGRWLCSMMGSKKVLPLIICVVATK